MQINFYEVVYGNGKPLAYKSAKANGIKPRAEMRYIAQPQGLLLSRRCRRAFCTKSTAVLLDIQTNSGQARRQMQNRYSQYELRDFASATRLLQSLRTHWSQIPKARRLQQLGYRLSRHLFKILRAVNAIRRRRCERLYEIGHYATACIL